MKNTLSFLLIVAGLFISFQSAAESDKTIKLVIYKSLHTLEVHSVDQVIAAYPVSIGRQSKGQKVCKGDDKTPEGVYSIIEKKANSAYYKAFRLSYPNEHDVSEAKKKGCSPGGDIMIHGIKNRFAWIGRLHRFIDWTKGCVALTNAEIDQLWKTVALGTVVEIKP